MPSAAPVTPDATASPWWNVWTMRYAPREAASNGLGGVSIEIQGGPNEGAVADTMRADAAMAMARSGRENIGLLSGISEVTNDERVRRPTRAVGCEMPGGCVTLSTNENREGE